MGGVIAQTEYLTFEDATPDDRKTRIVFVISRRHNDTLGTIKWYGAWRQYCFFPRDMTIWNTACLMDVREFIATLHAERRTDEAARIRNTHKEHK